MSRLLDVPPYALRYWQTEFPALHPSQDAAGRSVYGEEHLRHVRRVRELLYEEGYTIDGAKRRLEVELRDADPAPPPPAGSAGDRPLVWAAADKAGGAAVNLDRAAVASRRIEAMLDQAHDEIAARELLHSGREEPPA